MNPIPRRHFLSVPFAAAASASIYAHGGQRDASPGGVRRLTHPGFLDLQVNGFAGVDFNDPATSVEQIEHALAVLRSHGVTRLLPTIIVGPFDRVRAVRAHAAEGTNAGNSRAPPRGAVHLARRGRQGGASPRRHGSCLDRRLQTAAGRRRWTRAPGDDCAGSAGRARADRAPARHGHPGRDRPHCRYARADPCRHPRRRHALHASRERLRADAAAPSELHLGATGRRRAAGVDHRGRPSSAARYREDDDPREDTAPRGTRH